MTETGAKSWDTSALAATSWGSGSIYGMASYQRRDEFVGDPVISSGTPLQISQLPQEDLSGFYAGIRQEAGDITFSLDASRFRRDRRARLDFPDTPRSNRDYRSKTTGWTLGGNMHWDGEGETAVDVNFDYGETDSGSRLTYGSGRVTGYNHRNTLFVADARDRPRSRRSLPVARRGEKYILQFQLGRLGVGLCRSSRSRMRRLP